MIDITQQLQEWREAGLVRVTRKHAGTPLPDGVYMVQVLQVAAAEPNGDVDAVFAHWQQVHGHETAKLNAARRRLIRLRMKDFSQQDLLDCISGYRKSAHHMGQNTSSTRYDSIELMLRDAKHIEYGLNLHRATATAVRTRGRDDPQASIDVDLSRDAWLRDMRERTGNPNWQPPVVERPAIDDIVRMVRIAP